MSALIPLIDLIAGARPNFVKIASIVRQIKLRQNLGSPIQYRLIHTGQHYDAQLSSSFFEQLDIPLPNVTLKTGSGTQAEQTASIMIAYEKVLFEQPSDLCLVVGDVNSTMACAIAAQKLHIKVAHVEAGIRSGDWTMPEEINRRVTDAISNFFFTTSILANENLQRSGVSKNDIYFVGNTMIDTLLINFERLRPPSVWAEYGLARNNYIIMTLHRPSNVDTPQLLTSYLAAVCDNVQGLPVFFPVHPRTAKNLQALNRLPENLVLIEPQPYLEFNYLVKNAKAVITDSGGITEESTWMGVPCLTLRDTTERPETIDPGTNVLVGTKAEALKPWLHHLFNFGWKKGGIPDKWDGKASERIVAVLEKILY